LIAGFLHLERISTGTIPIIKHDGAVLNRISQYAVPGEPFILLLRY